MNNLQNQDLEMIKLHLLNSNDTTINIINKMKRDILASSAVLSLIDEVDNLKLIYSLKDAKLMITYLLTQLDFLELACKNGYSDSIKDNLLASPYNMTTYKPNIDYEYWKNIELYVNSEMLQDRLMLIHNSSLAINSTKLYISLIRFYTLLKYHAVNEALRLKITASETPRLKAVKDIYNENVNKVLITLYDIYTYINALVKITITNNMNDIKNDEYTYALSNQKHVCKDAIEIQNDIVNKLELTIK